MFNSAAKLQLGLAATALAMATAYAFAADDPGGFLLLAGISLVMTLIALAVTGSGFADRAPRYLPGEDVPPVEMITMAPAGVPRPSPWPFTAALAFGVFALGLAVGQAVVNVGIVLGLVVTGGWFAQCWREDPHFSRREGSRIAERLLAPVGLPLLAISLVAVIVLSVSRVLLSVPKNASIIIALALAIVLMVAFFALSSRPRVGKASMVFLSGFAVVSVVAAGSVSAASGYRTFEKHETGAAPITIVARNIQFHPADMTVKRNETAAIVFKNMDPTYHNVAVYSQPVGGVPFWNGEPVRGPKSITYIHQFTMAPGEYAFRCDFHPVDDREVHGDAMRRSRLAAVGGGLIGLLLLLGGCTANSPQDALKPKGSQARLLNSLFAPVFWIAVAVFVLIGGLVTFCLIRFRARSDDEAPRQIHGSTKLEIGWTIAPALLLLCIAVPTVKFVFDVNKIPKNAMNIVVTGHRWWWQADYMNQASPDRTLFTTATELHIPTRTNVVISLTSDDVIHNFWVPELAGKLYAIPGRHNKLVVEADNPGTYYGQCAEYCGTSHANMRLRVVAQTAADFATWETEQAAGPALLTAADATTGSQLFTSTGCAGCHAVTGVSSGVVGPNLTHFKSRSVFAGGIFDNTDNNLRLWLANPPGQKPGSVMPNLHLSADQINALIAYLDGLK